MIRLHLRELNFPAAISAVAAEFIVYFLPVCFHNSLPQLPQKFTFAQVIILSSSRHVLHCGHGSGRGGVSAARIFSAHSCRVHMAIGSPGSIVTNQFPNQGLIFSPYD
jgi:hypothetical protein